MQTKPLLYGLVGFFIGGFLVSVAATTFDKPESHEETSTRNYSTELSMSEMTESLRNKTGDAYDAAFIQHMIAHHQAAVDMAKLSKKNAKHTEIKRLSDDIVEAQELEIERMKQWQQDWGYTSGTHKSH